VFARILEITDDPCFHEGEWKLLDAASIVDTGDGTARNLLIYEWKLRATWKLIAINLKEFRCCAWVRFKSSCTGSNEYVLYDELHDVRYARKAEELRQPGLFIGLDGFQTHLFDVTPVGDIKVSK
jgi:hypothetical protein